MTCAIKPGDILKAPIFSAGMIGMIALFGIAWLADTFVQANIDYITELLSDLVTAIPFLFAVALFAMAALTTSQSATTKSIVPIGIALGMPAQLLIAMWPSLIGVYFLPANGTQLAAIAADRTGSTKIGGAVINHSFQPNTIFMWVVTVIVGVVLALVIHGTDAAAGEPSDAAAPVATEQPAETPPAETPSAETPAETEPAQTEAAETEPAEETPEPTAAEEGTPSAFAEPAGDTSTVEAT
jgi:hypothetical protein